MLWVTNATTDKTSDNDLHNIAIMQSCTCALVPLCNSSIVQVGQKRELCRGGRAQRHIGDHLPCM